MSVSIGKIYKKNEEENKAKSHLNSRFHLIRHKRPIKVLQSE